MKILSISDKIVDIIYSPCIKERFKDIDFIISCGDLPNNYLEFIVTMLNKPLFYVFGNHHKDFVYTENGIKEGGPEGCINLDNRIIEHKGLLLCGFEGSMCYSNDKYQFTDFQMCMKINRLKPKLFINKIFKKRYVDILVTHAPPYKVHDREDLCHRGFKCFNKFIKNYKPKYHIHGHVHLYGLNNNNWLTEINNTRIVNTFGYRVIDI